jgi:hypothetical protein
MQEKRREVATMLPALFCLPGVPSRFRSVLRGYCRDHAGHIEGCKPLAFESKVVTLGKLEGAAAVLPQARPTCSSSNPQRGEVAGGLQNKLRLKSGGVGERLKPAVLKFDLLASLADLTGLSPSQPSIAAQCR